MTLQLAEPPCISESDWDAGGGGVAIPGGVHDCMGCRSHCQVAAGFRQTGSSGARAEVVGDDETGCLDGSDIGD